MVINMSLYINPLLLALSVSIASSAGNAADVNQDEVLELREKGNVLPFLRILDSVFERHPDAQILEVELEEEDGKYYYELEILVDEGVVRELEIDAVSGVVLKDELED